MQATNNTKPTAQQAIDGIAHITKVSADVVRATLLKAGAKELRECTDGTGAIVAFMLAGGQEIVDKEPKGSCSKSSRSWTQWAIAVLPLTCPNWPTKPSWPKVSAQRNT